MRGAVAVACLVVLAASGEPPRAQTPSQTFRTGVDLVQVDVTVLDHDRRPIRDLTEADFTVLEDGKPRPIAAFTPVELPPPDPEPPAKWMLNVRSDVVSNDISHEGRLVVILMDRSIRTSDSVWAKRIATAAVDGSALTTSARSPTRSGARRRTSPRIAGGSRTRSRSRSCPPGLVSDDRRQPGGMPVRPLHARDDDQGRRLAARRPAAAQDAALHRTDDADPVARRLRRAPARGASRMSSAPRRWPT